MLQSALALLGVSGVGKTDFTEHWLVMMMAKTLEAETVPWQELEAHKKLMWLG